MLITAKCIINVFETNSCVLYTPQGGPLPDGLYEIDRDGPLAKIKLGSTYCFEFDRNAGPDDKPHIYSCKKPGCEALKPFKTLNNLGTHTRSAHKDDLNPLAEPEGEDEVLDLSDRTCTICQPHKVLRTAYGLRLHNEKSHPFQSQPIETQAETAVPA